MVEDRVLEEVERDVPLADLVRDAVEGQPAALETDIGGKAPCSTTLG
jgi:hypothetical protein